MRKKRLVANTVSSFLFRICTIVCGFVLPRIILSNFGSEVNGLVNSITQFLGIITFLELGVGAVIQSALYKPLADKDSNTISEIMVSGQKFFSKIALVLLLYVVILSSIYPYITEQKFGVFYTVTLIVIISISSFAQYYFGIVNSLLLTADQRGYISYNIQTITLILNTVICAVLIKLGASIHIVKLTTSIIYVVRPLVLAAYVRKNYKINWKIRYKKEPIQQKWNGVAQHIAAVVLDSTDSIILTIFVGLKAVSIYSVYNLVVSGIKQLIFAITNGIQALMGELWAKQELDELRNFFGWIEWAIHTGTIFVFGVTIVLILPFVQIYTVGVEDVNYVQPLFALLLIAANAGHCLRLPYNIMILAGGHYKQTQNNYIVAAIINIVISVLAVQVWGLIGVAVGTLVAMFYQTIWMAIYDSRNLICWPIRFFCKQLFVDMVTVLCLLFVSSVIRVDIVSWSSWILYAILVSMVAMIIVLGINMIFYREHIKRIVENLKGMLWKRKMKN